MKEITNKQLEQLACPPDKLREEIRFCHTDWIKENARIIADIETKFTDKTLYGEWPKGWRAEMTRAAKEMAKKNLIDKFMRRECFELNGVIWLGNLQIIESMERKSA